MNSRERFLICVGLNRYAMELRDALSESLRDELVQIQRKIIDEGNEFDFGWWDASLCHTKNCAWEGLPKIDHDKCLIKGTFTSDTHGIITMNPGYETK